MQNLITDIEGLRVGHAHDEKLGSGVTAIIFDEPTVTAVDVRGGAPGTRDTDLLGPEKTVAGIDALCLSGGSAFGLDAAGGVQAALAEMGRGFAIGPVRVPIVPAAIIFDMLNGGHKQWGRFSPYRDLGYQAAQAASDRPFALGSIGGGYGATTADLKGGLGSASALSPSGHKVAALVVVNAIGSVTIGTGPHFWSATEERGNEFGGLGLPHPFPRNLKPKIKGAIPENTTIAAIVTDALLIKAECLHLAIMAQDGLAIAIRPIHTPLDGDTVFASATGRVPLHHAGQDLGLIGMTAASVLARACARAIYEATALPFGGSVPDWRSKHNQIVT